MAAQIKQHDVGIDPQVAVVSGASSGIGKEAAKALVAQGWRVIGLGRNPSRCEAARVEIEAVAADKSQITMICVDLSLMADVLQTVTAIKALTSRVDVLLNNAGGITKDFTLTAEGNEATFASNHLGPFLLTLALLPLLRQTAAAAEKGSVRIVNVSSAAHTHVEGMDWDDLQSIKNYESTRAYCRAKLANLLFTHELVQQLKGLGIVVHAMHPGIVSSNFFSHANEAMQNHMRAQEDTAHTPAQAADTLIWLATAAAPAETMGQYFYQREAVATASAAQDATAAKKLWCASEALVAPWFKR